MVEEWWECCNKFNFFLCTFGVVSVLIGWFCIKHDDSFYREPIARITTVSQREDIKGISSGSDPALQQRMTAILLNGTMAGRSIELKNTSTYAQAYDLRYRTGDKVFVTLKTDGNGKILSAGIVDFKRDSYLAYAGVVFVVLVLVIGGMKGFRSIASVIANTLIFGAALKLYLNGENNAFVIPAASLFFIVFSILIVNGRSRKSIAAILGTIAGTLFSMTVAFIALKAGGSSLHYEEMEFLSRPPQQIFFMELLIGTLGGIMDIAISISSAVAELISINPMITTRRLRESGMEIGRDIMGTMANTLVFAYISGSIPIIVLWLKNGYNLLNVLSVNLSLELIRALVGSIGIVLSIPLTVFLSIALMRRDRKEGTSIW